MLDFGDLETVLTFEDFKSTLLSDYRLAYLSRQCSLLGRKEVLTGKAKFGIFGDGKELPQLAWSKVFQNGDFRSGYYRDQTFMMAIGALNPESFFAGLYAHTDLEAEPMSAGRQMGGHFATHSLDENGNWLNLMEQKNSSADLSPTGAQMPKLLGLAQASKIYRELPEIKAPYFTDGGNEVAWGTIGNASTSEGLFFETINAAGVLQVPMVISVWDDDYGISVHAKHQTTKESISEILSGFQRSGDDLGFEIMQVKGWDYPALVEVYENANELARNKHIPVIIHVTELTQPQGHSTSGSHERYKDSNRLKWEADHDCLVKYRTWLIQKEYCTEKQLKDIEEDCEQEVKAAQKSAWKAYLSPIIEEQNSLLSILIPLAQKTANNPYVALAVDQLKGNSTPIRKDVISTARKVLRLSQDLNANDKSLLQEWIKNYHIKQWNHFSSHLYSAQAVKAHESPIIAPYYGQDAPQVDGRIILRDNFDALLEKRPEMLIFGEDAGVIGDVNQGLEGLQDKFGKLRVADTGIREASIIGQGIGMALRGLRPIAEIQYLDYVLYGLQIMSDDIATLHYRTKGRQKAPLIVRTRGHRLEGIWHSGSPMGGIVNLLRGMFVLVPRNMTQAAGFYNHLMTIDTPALVIECLNGYRLKESLPDNLGSFTTPFGVVETLRSGDDLTVVSYGSTLRLVMEASQELASVNINIEVIDIQSLIPFDLNHDIKKSIAKTNRLLVVDEDVPGGASAYILDAIVNGQQAFEHLDSAPQTLTAKDHRPAYSTDGDYFSKPSLDDIFEKAYAIMNEADPEQYPAL